MKIKEGFILRTVAKENVVVAVGKASVLLNGIIKLNNTGAFLWNILKDGAQKEELVDKLVQKYGISQVQAEVDVESFLQTLHSVECIEK